ncbi:uncharacterized protein LOC131646112 [Vicia villosa]|uniref:uncharacterized protein LOC131646112 n=1 Tax=Vicia villosa TaxID=3911 RepID=UPI00273BE4BC|nr:uncharacterized protein LOC131646112 [Vicia villosa]
MIQVIVPTYLVSKFKSEIASGSSYIMQNFKVRKNDFSFKSTNHSYKFVFCGSTSVKKTDLSNIPVCFLNILGLDSIVEGRFQSNVLVDIIGGVTEISQSQVNGDNNKNRVVFTIVNSNKFVVQCTLWGQLVVQLYEYYKNNNEDSNIVIVLINARVKEAQRGFPVSVSNTWNGTKLLINDLRFDEVKNLKERLGVDFPLLSSSSLQVEATQNSYYSDYDKFVWKEITCVTVATLDKFEDGKMGWYKLGVLTVDGKAKAKFIFWNNECVKLIGKFALQMKMDLVEGGDYDPLEFPYGLDSILKKELAIRAVFQSKNGRLSVIGFKDDEDSRTKIKDSFKFEEEPLSASAEYDPSIKNFGLTPSKRSLTDAMEDVGSVQQSSTKLTKDVKKEK